LAITQRRLDAGNRASTNFAFVGSSCHFEMNRAICLNSDAGPLLGAGAPDDVAGLTAGLMSGGRLGPSAISDSSVASRPRVGAFNGTLCSAGRVDPYELAGNLAGGFNGGILCTNLDGPPSEPDGGGVLANSGYLDALPADGAEEGSSPDGFVAPNAAGGLSVPRSVRALAGRNSGSFTSSKGGGSGAPLSLRCASSSSVSIKIVSVCQTPFL